ncbi:hypothetical protein TNCV_1159291 [Trichonephila clavipes]|nr:hypothetical protein TNCV_1159291 [Trichonephila clavipes]
MIHWVPTRNMVAIDAKFSANSTQQPRYLKVLIESPFQLWESPLRRFGFRNTTLCRLRGSRVQLLLRRIGSSSSRKPCRFFPSQMMHFSIRAPGISRYTPWRQGCIWWLAKQKICRQTKITSEKHLGWGIAGGLMNGTPIDKQEKGNFLSQSY